jgi:broad specificity phosphatase PhoE
MMHLLTLLLTCTSASAFFVAPLPPSHHHSRFNALSIADVETSQSTSSSNDISSMQLAASHSILPVYVVDAMPEPLPLKLRNHYYLLRHGQSTANVASVISSDRALAYTNRHDVTELGYQQGKDSAAQLATLLQSTLQQQQLQPSNATSTLLFVSSPFARARSTAQACIDGWKELPESQRAPFQLHPTIVLQDALVERHFGRLDKDAIYTYAYVWPLDKFNVTHTAFDVESVAAVCHRIRALLLELETSYENTHIVLTSHADVLQITQLYAAQASNVGLFSSYRFANGEVRRMAVHTTDHLPDPVPLEAPMRGTRMDGAIV